VPSGQPVSMFDLNGNCRLSGRIAEGRPPSGPNGPLQAASQQKRKPGEPQPDADNDGTACEVSL